MTEALLSTRFLFRFSVPCLYHAGLSAEERELGEEYRLPALGELEGDRALADVRAAWCETGLVFAVRVEGKRQPVWCREGKLADSDGVQIWIDTRDARTIHRATRFCHRFIFLPAGGGRQLDQPVADQLLVDRARENANPVRPGQLSVRSRVSAGGYSLWAFVPPAALTGFQADDHPRLGFTYSVFDRELGEQTFSVCSQLPFASDPGLWGTLELVR
jgi:hypothetical protein